MRLMVEENARMVQLFEAARPLVDKFLMNFRVMFMFLLCMDGRVEVSQVFDTPLGLLRFMRTAGGRLRLGWPLAADTVEDYEAYCYSHPLRLKPVFVVTYHFSEGDDEHGCAAFKNQTREAMQSAYALTKEIWWAFDKDVKTLLIGIDTKSDGVIIHSEEDPDVFLDMRKIPANADEQLVADELRKIRPHMHSRVAAALVKLLMGNLRRQEYLRINPKNKDELVHGEHVLCYGDSFQWVRLGHRAIKVGPWDPEPGNYLRLAARLIKDNVEAVPSRVIASRGVLMTSKGFWMPTRRKLAELQSLEFLEVARREIAAELPEWEYLEPFPVTTDMNSMQIYPCEGFRS